LFFSKPRKREIKGLNREFGSFFNVAALLCFRHNCAFRGRGVCVRAIGGAAPVGHADHRPTQEGFLRQKQSVSSNTHRNRMQCYLLKTQKLIALLGSQNSTK